MKHVDWSPYNANARNLEVLGNLYLAFHKVPVDVKGASLAEELINAVSVEPQNQTVLANLQNLYAYFQSNPQKNPYPYEELKQRLEMVQEIRDHMIKSPSD